MAKTLFEAIGYRLGRKAAQVKNAFDLMGGSDEESLRAEIGLGRDMAAALLERVPLAEETDQTQFASQILRWLAPHVTERKLPFQVWITAQPEINSVAVPGGPIFLSWPLLDLCRGQRDEIAFLIGHEMGHIVRRHLLDRILKDAAVSLLLRQTSGRSAAAAWLNRVGQRALTQACSADNELEADAFAWTLLKSAGADPLAAESVLEKFSVLISGHRAAKTGDYFDGHPPVNVRLVNLRKHSRTSH